jgi:stage II sporulation protein D
MKIVMRMVCLMMVVATMATPFSATLEGGVLDNIVSYFRNSGPPKPPTIKVLVLHDRPGVVVEVKGKYKLFDPHTGKHISTRFVGKRKFIQAVHDGLKWGEEFPGVHQLMIVPDEQTTTTIVDGVEYKGPIFIFDIGGTISAVNQVYIEDYLSSILAKKYQNLPKELLAAIAISARTHAYYRAQNPKSQYWAVDGTKVGYQGVAAVDTASEMEQALKATRYMVMSKGSSSQGEVAAIPAEWKNDGASRTNLTDTMFSVITLADAEAMAAKGDHAAQILAKAFPGVKIELIHYAPADTLTAVDGEN